MKAAAAILILTALSAAAFWLGVELGPELIAPGLVSPVLVGAVLALITAAALQGLLKALLRGK